MSDDREELLETKMAVDRQIRDLKLRIYNAGSRAKAKGKYIPRGEYLAMKDTLNFLMGQSQELQLRLRKAPPSAAQSTPKPPKSVHVEFVNVASEWLPPDTFANMLAEAKARCAANLLAGLEHDTLAATTERADAAHADNVDGALGSPPEVAGGKHD